MGNALSELAVRALWRGEDEQARARVHEAVDVQRSRGDRWNLANILLTAGRIDVSTGHLDVGRAEIHEAFVVNRAIRSRNSQAPILLLTLAQLLTAEGRLAPAAELLVAVEAYLGGLFRDRRYRRIHEELRTRLGITGVGADPLSIDEAMSRAYAMLESGATSGTEPVLSEEPISSTIGVSP